MRILFLGGTGNISAAASRLLVRQGHDGETDRLLDRLLSAYGQAAAAAPTSGS